MLLTTPEQYYGTLTKLAQTFEHGILTSFGVFAGIGFDADINDKYPSEERAFLDSIANHPDMSMIIGVHGYYSPFPKDVQPGNCRHCIAAYTRRTLRIEKHREIFPNIKWYILRSLHSKVASFWNDKGVFSIIGSRNFTNSPNHEAAFLLKGNEAVTVRDYALSLQNQGQLVDLDGLIDYLVTETGSDYCLKVVCGEV